MEKYPFLGRAFVGGKPFVVLFTDLNKGVVVMDDTDDENIKFGAYGEFNENKFELLPKEECVRLSN